jgi:arylsulfatase A-like enzyme
MHARAVSWVLSAALAALTGTAVLTVRSSQGTDRPPNFVLILLDDSGYADTSAYGAKAWRTRNVDRLAREGIRFTSFYVPQPVCSASRAALLTGSYSNRVGITGALPSTSRIGINPSEELLPEILKKRGYATGIFGKWHLGAAPPFLPLHHGFDEYFGIPYSNDMRPSILVEGDKALRELTDEDKKNYTSTLTAKAVSFIDRHRDEPFFLYVPHNMPHVPLWRSSTFEGKTPRLYGDVMMELDWSVGQILDAIKRNGLDDNTLVMFLSDNGPWLIYGDHAGSAAPFREGKHTTFGGGVRVPFVARWPGHIKPGSVSRTPIMSLDLLPTLARLAEAEVPQDRVIDGRDVWDWVSGKRTSGEPHEAMYFYNGTALEAVIAGRWKLTLPHRTFHALPANGGVRGKQEPFDIGLSLFDLAADPGETTDVGAAHEDAVARLTAYAEQARADLGDRLTGRVGTHLRPAMELSPGASPLPDGVVVPEGK